MSWLSKKPLFTLLLLSVFANAGAGLPNEKMNYRDYEEINNALFDLRDNYGDVVTLKAIGRSPDFVTEVNRIHEYDIYAIRIKPAIPTSFVDEGDSLPAILFVGGIHGREWLASEALIELAYYLAEKSQDPGTPEYALLRRVPIWIIPLANPAGRVIDDQSGGDPEVFYPGSGSGNAEYGWRHSGDTRGCESGVDINRNFSVGWNDAYPGCSWADHYKGLAPFSTMESVALRQFVQNHWIAMAVDVHTSSQLLWNIWGNADRAGSYMREAAVTLWHSQLLQLAQQIYDPPSSEASSWIGYDWWILYWWNSYWQRLESFAERFGLAQERRGLNDGQFTAWLAEEQRIQTFLLELPPEGSVYDDSEFRYENDDKSNSFHPSSSRVLGLISEVFVPTALHFIGQASAPSCATTTGIVFDGLGSDLWATPQSDGCPYSDLGVLAAKIGENPQAPGALQSANAFYRESESGRWEQWFPAFDYLYPSNDGKSYKLYYWLQNSGRSYLRRGYVRIQLRSRSHGFDREDYPLVDDRIVRNYSVRSLEKMYDEFSFNVVPGRDYELSIRASSGDEFNDLKLFRFTTAWPPWQ